jgi:hypothetical protein
MNKHRLAKKTDIVFKIMNGVRFIPPAPPEGSGMDMAG